MYGALGTKHITHPLRNRKIMKKKINNEDTAIDDIAELGVDTILSRGQATLSPMIVMTREKVPYKKDNISECIKIQFRNVHSSSLFNHYVITQISPRDTQKIL